MQEDTKDVTLNKGQSSVDSSYFHSTASGFADDGSRRFLKVDIRGEL